MGNALKYNFKEFAWNGISFLAPDNWHAVIVEKQYLLLEDQAGPVMEIKWSRVKGSFSHKSHLKRLTSLNKNRPGQTLKKSTIPVEWKNCLKNFNASAFTWTRDRIRGRGMMLYCPLCRNAIIMQFYEITNRQLQYPYEKILDSFSDHNTKNETAYSIFNIRVSIPEQFKLKRHLFESGRYQLEFNSSGAEIVVYNWGPASIILNQTSLAGFAGSVLHQPETNFSIRDGGKIVEWYKNSDTNLPRYFLSRIKRGYSSWMFRIWHDEDRNRILAIHMRFKKAADGTTFDRICDSYETI